VKEFLSQRGVQYVEKDVSVDQSAAAEMVRVSGQRGVPVTVINGRVVVGYDQALLTQLLASDRRVRLGAAVADASEMAAKGLCRAAQGAYVGKVNADSPAGRGGLAAGDVIVALGGRAVKSSADLEALVARLRPGLELPVRYVRGEEQRETTLSL
jgi:S1-C subfamily serine protease